ncbi:MAG: prepilin-type N-terminal cleavage/methylation domain-containing protein [Firmicutes bacterium]|nr:prepilin-type N-terminal cleavage/methylation domain-containing protein [Bacillota bacterium]
MKYFRQLRNNRGFTLVEVIIAVFIIGLIIPALIDVLAVSQKTINQSSLDMDFRQSARAVLFTMVRDIQQAKVVQFITPQSLGLTGPNNEVITYTYQATAQKLMRTENGLEKQLAESVTDCTLTSDNGTILIRLSFAQRGQTFDLVARAFPRVNQSILPFPRIIAANPNLLPVGYSPVVIEIMAENTHFVNRESRVQIGPFWLADVQVLSPTLLRGTLPAGLGEGTYDVIVETNEEIAILPDGFQVTPRPTIQSVTPNSVLVGYTPTLITIIGANTHFAQGVTTAQIGAQTLTNVQVTTPTALSGILPSGLAEGTYDVVVKTGGEEAALTQGFRVVNTLPPAWPHVPFPGGDWHLEPGGHYQILNDHQLFHDGLGSDKPPYYLPFWGADFIYQCTITFKGTPQVGKTQEAGLVFFFDGDYRGNSYNAMYFGIELFTRTFKYGPWDNPTAFTFSGNNFQLDTPYTLKVISNQRNIQLYINGQLVQSETLPATQSGYLGVWSDTQKCDVYFDF